MNDTQQIPLNDAVPFIINNLEIQKRCICDNKQCPVTLISGAPGIGKSDLMSQIAIKTGAGLNPQYLGTMLIEQFGMPLPVTDENAQFQKWSLPEFYSTENLRINMLSLANMCYSTFEDEENSKRGDQIFPDWIILFMDDLHLATKTIQTYFFQLLTYRSIHNKKMPDNFLMVAAGNRSIDRAGAQPIMAPIVNRFFVIDVKATADDWIKNFAIPNKLRQDIISFIEFYPDLLQSEPLESKPWASPRSWTYLSDALNQYEETHEKLTTKNLLNLSKGHIGLDYATKFVEYVKLFSQWDVKLCLDGLKLLPDLKVKSKIEHYTLMSALMAEFLKRLRSVKFNSDHLEIQRDLLVLKNFLAELAGVSKEIIPLGLRSLILSEVDNTKQAILYQKIIGDNPILLEATKNVLGIK